MNGSCNCKHFHFPISPPSYINSIEDDSWDKLEDCPIFPEQHANIERTIAEEEIAADDNQVVQKPKTKRHARTDIAQPCRSQLA